MKKSVIAIGLALILLLAPLTACQDTKDKTSPTTDAPTAEPTWESVVPNETAENNFVANTVEHAIDDFNVLPRDEDRDMLTVFTPMHGERSRTSSGTEAIVVDGVVTSVGGCDNLIPENGYIIHGKGKLSSWVQENILEGSSVTTDRGTYTLVINQDKQAFLTSSLSALRSVKDRLTRYRDDIAVAEEADGKISEIEAVVAQIRSAAEGTDLAALYERVNELVAEAEPLTLPSFTQETRAIWHIIDGEKTKEDVRKIMEKFASANLNCVMLEVFAHGYVIYPDSEYARQRPDTKLDFDILEEYVTVGKELGIDVHAWSTNYFVGEPSFKYNDNKSGSPVFDDHPEWAALWKDGKDRGSPAEWNNEDGFMYINPVLPEVSEFLINLYTEMSERYEIKGINIDYIRYSSGSDSPSTSMGFDEYSINTYLEETGVDIRTLSGNTPEWEAYTKWRADHITAFVKELSESLDATGEVLGRDVLLSACVGSDKEYMYNAKCQDWPTWLENNYLDFAMPMAYYSSEKPIYDVVDYMVSTYPDSINITGLSALNSGTALEQVSKQVMAAREAGAVGVCFFYSGNLARKHIAEMTEGVFRTKATPLYENITR